MPGEYNKFRTRAQGVPLRLNWIKGDDMSEFDSVEERLWLFMGLLQNGNGIWSWCFSETGELYYSSCPKEKELLTMFRVSGCMEYALSRCGQEEGPFAMGDPTGLLWFGEYFFSAKERRLMVVGPVFAADTSISDVQKAVGKYDISIQMKRQFLRIIGDIPVVDQKFMAPYGKMLHYAITLKDSENLQMIFQSGDFSAGSAAGERMSDKTEERRSGAEADWGPDGMGMEAEDEKEASDWATVEEKRLKEESAGVEELLLRCVRTGNRNYMKAFAEKLPWSTHGSGEPAFDDHDLKSLRDSKNQLIILISSVAKAAEDGGCPKNRARELETYYLREVEKQETLPGLVQLNVRMLEDFIEQVRKGQELDGLSDGVREAVFYIREHIMEELTLEKLAREAGYTPYYLSRKFSREMGIQPLEYIRQQRLEYAKVWLTTTNRSIQEICEELHFGGPNYFGRVFKRETGMTPSEYRKRAKK